MADSDEKTFYLGITMAGAISAGAYTAGVLDKLLEALDLHNARYARARADGWQGRDPTTGEDLATFPRHRVVLKVMSGTSAGGVSTGLSLAGLIDARKVGGEGHDTQIEPQGSGDFTSPDGYRYDYDYILKPLHEVWVEALDLYQKDGDTERGLLTTYDLDKVAKTPANPQGGQVKSALNSEEIDKAAAASLSDISWNGGTYRFLARELDLFLTTTNLQGIPFEVRFSGSSRDAHPHAMSQHAIVRHFRVTGLGDVEKGSAWLEAWRDKGIDLPLVQGKVDFDNLDTNWPHFKDAAIATGAFPVGLSARVIKAEARDFGPVGGGETRGGALPINLKPTQRADDGTDFDARPIARIDAQSADSPVTYVAVDGGVANNEPFELARYALREAEAKAAIGEKFLKPNPRSADEADRAVLMIDPFPEGPVYTALEQAEAVRLAGVLPTAKALVPALINQARFKPSELIEATNEEVRSRFLLAPSRRETSTERAARGEAPPPARVGVHGSEAIACGSFGGFGGFMDRAFRAHDYMLGRRNCHSFISKHFWVSGKNPVLGLEGTDLASAPRVPVVQPGPDFAGNAPELPKWPAISQSRLDPVLAQSRARIGSVASMLVRLSTLPWYLQFALNTIWSTKLGLVEGLGPRLSKALRVIVISELIQREQYHDFRAARFEPWQRDVLVALARAGASPIPLALESSERAEVIRSGAAPDDLLAVVAQPGDGPAEWKARQEELSTFLASDALAGHVTRVDATPPRFMLTAMVEETRFQRLKRRIRGWFG